MIGTHPIHRSLLYHKLWQDRPFARGQAWVDLILLANHKDSSVMIRGVIIEVNRGQVFRSQITLAKRWGWTRGKVERFCKLLKTEQMIEHRGEQYGTLITLLNYDRLHKEAFERRAPKHTPKQTTNTHRTSTYNNDKNVKNEVTSNFLTNPSFKSIWDNWLEVRGKLKAPNTQRALQLALDKMGKYPLETAIKMLEQSVERGWRGVFPIKEEEFRKP